MENITLADRLKRDTLFHHQQLEKLIVGKIKSMASLSDYIKLLQHFYSFFGGLEEIIDEIMAASHLDDYTLRRKSKNLIHDIVSCGGEVPQKAPAMHLPAINTAEQAMGALYVIEGSTLGGQIISKMIYRHLNFTDEQRLAYFIGYGGQTESMWLRFKQSINEIDEEKGRETIETANETFIKFKAWIEKNDRKEEFQ